jgi:putative Ig domain-containing protein
MRRFTRVNKTLAAAAVVGSLLVLVASAGLALAFGVSPAASKPKTTTSTTTTGTTGTTTGSTPLSDSGSANCASDGGTLTSNVCVLADGQLNQQYEALIASSGGSGPTPFLFKVVAGSIPPGMQVPPDYAIGEHGTIIGGTPTKRGTYSFTIQVTDGAGDTATGQFSLTIA